MSPCWGSGFSSLHEPKRKNFFDQNGKIKSTKTEKKFDQNGKKFPFWSNNFPFWKIDTFSYSTIFEFILFKVEK